MADKKITDLVDGGAPQATDEFVVARAGDNFKLDWASLAGVDGATRISPGTWASQDSKDWECWAPLPRPPPCWVRITTGTETSPPDI